jgi:hypothetical protein
VCGIVVSSQERERGQSASRFLAPTEMERIRFVMKGGVVVRNEPPARAGN